MHSLCALAVSCLQLSSITNGMRNEVYKAVHMLHSMAQCMPHETKLTTAACAASLPLAMRLLCSCSVCCRSKALRCAGPARCCCSSATLLKVACSMQFRHSLLLAVTKQGSTVVAAGSTQAETSVRNDHHLYLAQNATKHARLSHPGSNSRQQSGTQAHSSCGVGKQMATCFPALRSRRCTIICFPLHKSDTVLMKNSARALVPD